MEIEGSATTTSQQNGSEAQEMQHHEADDTFYGAAMISNARGYLISAGLLLGLFLAMLDTSIVATSLYTIGTDLGNITKINWVALAYTLSFVGTAVLVARVADIIGRRDAFLTSFVVFIAFSLGCGFSQSLTQLVICRVFQGIGGAGLFSISMIAFPEVTPISLRPHIATMAGVALSSAGVLGPVLGGALTHSTTWRWIFWINGPIGLAGMVTSYLFWPKAEFLSGAEKRAWKDLDCVGSILVIISAVLVVFPFQNAGESSSPPWAKADFIVPLSIGILGWATLIAWELHLERRQTHKMAAVPLDLFRNRIFASAVFSTLFMGFPFFTSLYTVPLRLQVVNSESPLTAGLMLLPMLGASGIGSAIAGAISKTHNRLSETMMLASILVALGCALETTVDDGAALDPKLLGFLVFIGLGHGLAAAAVTLMTNAEAPIHECAPAQGIIAQVRLLGGSIGIAMVSAVTASTTRDQLSQVPPVPEGTLSTLNAAQYALVRKAYNDVFKEVMEVCSIVAGVAFLIVLGTWRRKRVTMQQMRDAQSKGEGDRRRSQMMEKTARSSAMSD